ncbi:rcc01693 family protein [Tabrizicola sp.]|uniref:rcc01693 family protein n=1 Tax=Tabrizicola sp. TaxID=2005166 RepID=UPI001A4D9FA0|nr:rcc01693 family protein [Tabrizicola sp.]MBL9075195.1 phage tail assembly chaperone [Tabrizicola sp.]
MSGIDWRGLMQAGLHGLGLEPAVFWRLTPVELKIMLGREGLVPPLTRARLAELAAAFPDVRKEKRDGGYRNDAGAAPGA